MMFDNNEYVRYQETVGEYLVENPRKKRSPRGGGVQVLSPLGIAMPCQVEEFKVHT